MATTTVIEKKQRVRFGYVVLTGRHKILDYDRADGQQIATADDYEAARLIRHRLNAYDTLVEAIKDAIAFIERDDTYSTDPEVKAASDALADVLVRAE